MSVQALKNEIKRMAQAHEESYEEYDKHKNLGGYYNLPLNQMSEDNEWSFPAYIMLSSWWNDALDWANDVYEKIKPPIHKPHRG